jgi:hypothetical protein
MSSFYIQHWYLPIVEEWSEPTELSENAALRFYTFVCVIPELPIIRCAHADDSTSGAGRALESIFWKLSFGKYLLESLFWERIG